MNDQDANIIQSLSRGLAALDHVARQSTTPRSLAEAMGVDRSTAYRILVTLAAHGFVERDPLSEQYMISSRKLVALGSTVSASLHWHTLASPWLKQLRDETGEAVNIAVLQGSEVVYVNHLPSYEAITVSPLLGLRRPVHVSAVGKAIVAFLPPGEQDALLSRIELKAATPNTITIPREFRKELERVRALGFAFDDEETFIGVRCVAAPIRDQSNQVIASMGLSGPASRVTRARAPELGGRVRALANEFSISLGATAIVPIEQRR